MKKRTNTIKLTAKLLTLAARVARQSGLSLYETIDDAIRRGASDFLKNEKSEKTFRPRRVFISHHYSDGAPVIDGCRRLIFLDGGTFINL